MLQGALESLVIGEVRLLTRRPSRDSQNNELARSCVFQVLFYDAEIVIRKDSKQSFKKGHHQKRHSYSHGKWMIFANLAKYVTVSVAELLVQVIVKLIYHVAPDLFQLFSCSVTNSGAL